MSRDLEPLDKPLVITLRGDLGLLDRDRVEALLPDPSMLTDRIVIDCTNVDSMDSSILALLMIYRRRLMMAGRDPLATMVALAPPRLIRLFDMTGISRSITVLPVEMPTD